ncbi:PREDICTED: urokinase plasminogen activator surface receptor-like [Nanorana parkeri]|uniref:urokinase plasminogen activator surface receptor-like n=1 Tax=Nanorana parkeri TaxID=125878 RepID=UPI0008547026|nr:PREDICTED: urokinase plasminogen activator surface receptor-like [Nanorana parkeri]
MRLLLHSVLYSALVCLASSLQCFHYNGLPDRAQEEQVAKTCESTHQHCSSSLYTYSKLLNGMVLVKGCSTGKNCNQTQSGPVKFVHTSETVLCCDTELCNEHLVPDLGEDPRIECLACHGHPSSCGGSSHPSLRCGKSQKSCIEVSITTALSQDIHHTMIKSCSNSSSCPGLAAFSNGKSPVSYSCSHRCCNGSLCNTGDFAVEDSGAENGLECYSRSSPEEASTMRCRGQMTRCVDLMGTSSHSEPVMSGCATEAFCQSLYPTFPIPGWTGTMCCTQSLCNYGNSTATNNVKH